MKEKELSYYLEWFKETQYLGDLSYAEIKEVALPYVLHVDNIGFTEPRNVYIALIASILLFLYIIYLLIKGLTGRYTSRVRKYIHNEIGASEDEIEADFIKSIRFDNIWIGKKYSYFLEDQKQI